MKYIPSIAYEEMSGSAKGVTAAKTMSRKYIRNRGYGGAVRTEDQAKVKGIFKMLTTSWKNLTNEQILAWNKLALSQTGRSVLGTSAKISGSNLFTRLNYWVVTLGGSLMQNPPEINSVETPSDATIACQGDTFTFKLDRAPVDNGGLYLVIEATAGMSNGVSRAHKKAAAIMNVEEPTAAVVDIHAAYQAKYGSLNASAPKVFFRYFFVDSTTGVKSQEMLAECKWSAAPAVAAPEISGTTPFSESTQVTMSGPDGATIYYTQDGSTPTSSSSQYSSAITLSATATIKAIAIKDGVSSEVASKTFTKSE